MQGTPELRAWQQEGGTVVGTSPENVCARMAGDCVGRAELAAELVRRFNGHGDLLDALRDALGFVDYVRELWARPGEVGAGPAAIGTQARLRAALERAERRAGAPA